MGRKNDGHLINMFKNWSAAKNNSLYNYMGTLKPTMVEESSIGVKSDAKPNLCVFGA